MRLLTGTSGYSYKAWLGHFYPEKLPAGDMLRYYASRFPAVEINNTFYRMPAASMLSQWSEQVPEHFTFALKAPRRITHDARLRDCEPRVAEFVRRAQALGAKLGAVLFQLPPYLPKDLPRLGAFLDCLPAGTRSAFEFRNASWHDDAVHALLRERGAMLCVTDTDEGDTPFAVTTDAAYVRLRRTHYDDAELAEWAERIGASGADPAYVFFMHEDEALGTRFAHRLGELWTARGARTAP